MARASLAFFLLYERSDRTRAADVDPGNRPVTGICGVDRESERHARNRACCKPRCARVESRSGAQDRMSALGNDNSNIAWSDRTSAGSRPKSLQVNSSNTRTWVLVAGDFHRAGGMDRANAELAEYLCTTGATVHLVSHRVDAELAEHPNVRVHRGPRIVGAPFLAQHRLDL